MTSAEQPTVKPKAAPGSLVLRAVLGFILLAPAALFCLLGLLRPTLTTVVTSFQKVDLSSTSQFVGLANYTRLLEDATFLRALNFTMSFVGGRLLVVAIVPLLLAFAVNEFGRGVRGAVRLLFTIPLALFAPVSAALVWSMALNPQVGLFASERSWLADPVRAGQALRWVDALSTFGLACGLGLIFYLAALRGWERQVSSPRKAIIALLVVWFTGLLATIALSLPTFTLSYVLTNGGPANSTSTLALLQYRQAFQFFQFGPAAALATLTLLVVALIGLVVALLIILTGLRFELALSGQPTGFLSLGRRPLAIILLILALCGSVGICSIGLLPFGWNVLNSFKTQSEIFTAKGSFIPAEPSLAAYYKVGQVIPLARVAVNTLVPPLLALLWQIPIAYLAALGIGAVRPLGKWSEWLLLPFSPWLFVTVSPLIIAAFESLREAGRLNTFLALTPPLLLSVPVLFILTLFFKGQETHYRLALAEGQGKAGAFFRKLILPSLPLLVLLGAATLLVNLQALLWPLVAANSLDHFTYNVALLLLRNQFQTAWPILAAAITLFQLPTFLFFFLVFGLLQILYLDRFVLRLGSFDLESRQK